MTPLRLAVELFSELESRGILYSHWKSNEHLDEALAGISDLDLLVEREASQAFRDCIADLGFIDMTSPRIKRFEGLEDHLGFDETTGELIHLHVHYRLVLGEKRVKNHHLPIEAWVLADNRMVSGVKIPRPEVELYLLYIRLLLKSDARTAVRAGFRRQEHPFPSSLQLELESLLSEATDATTLETASSAGLSLDIDDFADFLRRARSGRLRPLYVLLQKHRLLRQMRAYQRYPTAVCLARKVWFRLRYSRPFQRIRPIRKKVLRSAPVIAIVGADGSGKTTLSEEIRRWLNWKLCARHIYFGQPKQSIALKVIRKAGYGSRWLTRRLPNPPDPISRLAAAIEASQWVYLARRRHQLSRRARRLASRGEVVIAERFPLQELWSMDTPMDGPRLGSYRAASGLMRRLADLERRSYERSPAPSHTVILTGDLATLHDRKPDTDLEEHAAKVEAVNRIALMDRYQTLDASRPFASVLLQAKIGVWNTIKRMETGGR